MAINLKQTLEAYLNRELFSVSETKEIFDNNLITLIKNTNISDDLKIDFEDVYQEVCDLKPCEEWDDEDEETMQIVMFAFDFVIERILKELD